MIDSRRTSEPDPILLVEGVLGLGLVALFVWLFWIPAAAGPFVPRWWAGLLLASLFFGILGLETWRRRRQGRRILRQTVEEAKARAEAGGEPPPVV